MFDLNNIKHAAERNKKVLQLKPALARGSDTAKARLDKDMHFDIDVDGVKISAEVPRHYGGNGTGAGSSAHSLASLICCAMVCYLIKFAEKGIPLQGLEMEVKGDWDKKETNGYTGVRYIVNVESDAPEEEIQQAIEEAEAMSFGLAVLQQPVKTHRELRITTVS